MTAQKKITVTDTILRDAHQSLLATRMRTEDMLPICGKLDRVGYWSLEVWGGATFDACALSRKTPGSACASSAALPNTRLQMLLRGQNLLGYRHYSDDVVEAFCARAAENGIDVFRIFDAMNDVRNLETAIRAVKKSGKHAQGTIAYTTSPVHTVELFVEQARQMAAMGVDSIAIKDMAGLLTPFATGDLVRALKAEIDLPVFIHSHDTAGVASMCQLKAIENGADHIDTAISSMAWGTSHPGTESMVAALKGTPYDTGLDLELLQEIGLYFYAVRKKYHQFESEFTGVDTRVQVNQVPGGMISNLANQLRSRCAAPHGRSAGGDSQGAQGPRLPAAGHADPQIVGTQAFFNVLAGERYKTITTEVKYYLQGRYGKAPAPVCEHLRFQAIGSEEVIECRPADLLAPELDKLRKDIGELAKSEEDVLTFAMFPDIGRKFSRSARPARCNPRCCCRSPTAAPRPPASRARRPSSSSMCTARPTASTSPASASRARASGTSISIDGMPEEVVFEPLNAFVGGGGSQRKQASAPGDVSTTMPGNVVDVLVAVGDVVKAGQTVLVSEAMKMETEIQAPIAGTVKAVHVAKGDRVNPGEVLIEIEG